MTHTNDRNEYHVAEGISAVVFRAILVSILGVCVHTKLNVSDQLFDTRNERFNCRYLSLVVVGIWWWSFYMSMEVGISY